MYRRKFIASTGVTAMGLTVSSIARAQEYPKKDGSIRYVVPFAAGGLSDVMARLVGQQLSTSWNISVVIDNKPGNGGQIGASEVAKAKGDGQTLLAITLAHAANVTLFKNNAGYDFQKDLRPVALLVGSPMLIVVPANSPIKDYKDLVNKAKSSKLNAGSSGNGTPTHLALALFNDLNKTDIQHIPYKGGAPSMTDLIGGQIDVVFSNMPESIVHVKSGKLRALAIASSARHPLVPDVPTTAEAGAAGLMIENWTAIMAPTAMPDSSVAKLGQEVLKIMSSADIHEKARTQGFRIDARGPQQFDSFLKAEIELWGRVIKVAGISAS
jgi:tripartite-type tricarboxylate transporter receptor subunit TctC